MFGAEVDMVKLLLFFALLYFLYRYWHRLKSASAARTQERRPARFDTSKIEDAEFREVGSEGREEA